MTLTDFEAIRVVGDWSAASGSAGFRVLYKKAPDIDAVFVANDQMALGALRAAHDLCLAMS